jgi:hypothetical protein
MRRVAYVLFATVLMLVPLGSGGAQDVPADITILSVLTMAKQEAEKAPDEKARISLRYSVALAIEKTGHAASFGTYVADARSASQHRDSVNAAQSEITKFNLDVELRAKQAFLTGDVERAKAILNECRPYFPPPRCGPGEWRVSDDWFDVPFVWWDIEAGRLEAAWDRVKTGKWIPRARGFVAVMIGPHAAAGDQDKIFELTRLAMRAGDRFDSCIMVVRFDLAAPPEPYGQAAEIRKLSFDGHARAALDLALSQQSVGPRTNALLVVAEGLAGIPGLSNERLY